MDLAMSYIYEASSELKQIRPVSLFDSVFTEASVDVESQNEERVEKSANLLQKALEVIRSIYRSIKRMIVNFIDWIRLSGEDKSNYEKFVQECKNNPEFAKKKITVRNWKKINEAYDGAMNEIEKAVTAEVKSKESKKPNLFNWAKDKVEKATGVAKDVTVEITIEEALQWAKQSQDNAKALKFALETDDALIGFVDKEIGEARKKKLYKKMEKLSSDSKLIRFLAGSRKQKQKNTEDSMKELLSKINKYYKVAKRTASKNPDAKEVVDYAKDLAVDAGKQALRENIKLRSDTRAQKKELKRQKKITKKVQKENQ